MISRPCEACEGADFRWLFKKDGHDFYRCCSCDLVRLDPQPTDEVLATIYGTHYYDAWGVKHSAERVFGLKQATFREHVLPHVQLQPGDLVLDCGAAFGALMATAKEHGFEPYGIELAEGAAAEIARRFGPERVFSGPFENASFPGLSEGAFSAIFMCDFIEHVREPANVLKKAAALLKPGGTLVITTPDGTSASCKVMRQSWPHYKVEHLHYFGPGNIRHLLRSTGFSLRRALAAHKVFDFDYLRNQFNTYPRVGVTAGFNLLARWLPASLCQRPISFSFGEMLVVGVKE